MVYGIWYIAKLRRVGLDTVIAARDVEGRLGGSEGMVCWLWEMR